jgi:hypothetical protein
VVDTSPLVIVDSRNSEILNRRLVRVLTVSIGSPKDFQVLDLNRSDDEAYMVWPSEVDLLKAKQGGTEPWSPRFVVLCVVDRSEVNVAKFPDSELANYAVNVLSKGAAVGAKVPIFLFNEALENSYGFIWKVVPAPTLDPNMRAFQHAYQDASQRPRFVRQTFLRFQYRIGLSGPVDTFGFRNRHSYQELDRRPKAHRLCLVLGGSSAYGATVGYEEVFSTQLEHLVRERLPKGAEFSVLNFATAGNDVISDLMTFTLLGHRLRPDWVIWHSGFNDMLWGQCQIPQLVEEFGINKWHLSFSGEKTLGPRPVIDALLRRIVQLDEMVRSAGGRLVAGLPPAFFMKRLSDKEESHIRDFVARQGEESEAVWNIAHHYRQFARMFKKSDFLSGVNLIEFEPVFNNLEQRQTVFSDVVHLEPAGERIVAEIYADAILRSFGDAIDHIADER